MRKGGGKAKGARFERDICKALSEWVTAGKRDDVFWRSAMSGGRATVGKGKGIDRRHQAGDISSVHPDGHVLTSYWYVECKFVKDLNLQAFVLHTGGLLSQFWKVAVKEARDHRRVPMIIAKQNNSMTIVLIPESERVKFQWARDALIATTLNEESHAAILSFEKMMEAKPAWGLPTRDPAKMKRVRL